MTEEREDSRLRPVVLQTSAPEPDPRRRRSVRYLGWAGGVVVGVVGAAGLVAGGSAIWSAVDPGSPEQSPVWIQPPPPVEAKTTQTPAPVAQTSTPDDRSGRDHPEDSTSHESSQPTTRTATTDDHRGRSTPSTTSTDNHRGRSGPSSDSSSGTSGSDDSRRSGKAH